MADRLSPEDKQRIVALAEQGVHTLVIAKTFKTSRSTVYLVLSLAADGKSLDEPVETKRFVPRMDYNTRFLATTRNGQRRAPLRLPPLPIAGKGQDADGANVSGQE